MPPKAEPRANDVETGPPQLALDLDPLNMSAHNQNGQVNATLPKALSPAPPSSPLEPSSPIAPLPRRPSGLRRSSGYGGLSREPSPAPASNGDSYHLSDHGDNRAGKSGTIIRRLGNDKDRLQRLLNDETMQRQEAERAAEVAQNQIAKLKDENANLNHAHEADMLVLKRRDRQLDDLKAELAQEREKSQHHHRTAQQLVSERDNAVEQCQRDTSLANNQAKHASVHAEVLEQSHKQLKSEYRQRFETLSKNMKQLEIERDEERKKVARLDVVVEEISQQNDKTKKLNQEMCKAMETYADESERKIEQLKEEARTREAAERAVREEAARVMGEARWLINVGKNTAERRGLK